MREADLKAAKTDLMFAPLWPLSAGSWASTVDQEDAEAEEHLEPPLQQLMKPACRASMPFMFPLAKSTGVRNIAADIRACALLQETSPLDAGCLGTQDEEGENLSHEVSRDAWTVVEAVSKSGGDHTGGAPWDDVIQELAPLASDKDEGSRRPGRAEAKSLAHRLECLADRTLRDAYRPFAAECGIQVQIWESCALLRGAGQEEQPLPWQQEPVPSALLKELCRCASPVATADILGRLGEDDMSSMSEPMLTSSRRLAAVYTLARYRRELARRLREMTHVPHRFLESWRQAANL